MRVKNTDFRQMLHSIKYIEYYWTEFQIKYSSRVHTYHYNDDILKFIKLDLYNKLRNAKTSRISNDKIISRSQYRQIKYYIEICKNLKMELNK